MPSRQASHTEQQNVARLFKFFFLLSIDGVTPYTDGPLSCVLIPLGVSKLVAKVDIFANFVRVHNSLDVGLNFRAWRVELGPLGLRSVMNQPRV